ncbi:MAG: histidinol-phosphatase [Clostridium sp.]
MLKADFHTHTNYCDGNNTPEEMVEAAYRMGLTDYGISGHAYFPYGWDDGMSDETLEEYKKDLRALRVKYAGKMNLYIGIELDCLGPVQQAEYAIGSVHCLKKRGEYVMIDDSDAVLTDAVNRLWDGDWYALTNDYYALEATVYEKTHCDWIGHFDLITKFNQDNRHFDETRHEYLEPALAAMRHLNQAGIPFEINTGAISRGYRKEPYPSKILLKELYKMGGRIIINSDSHRSDTICHQFDMAVELAKECGFTHTCILNPGGGFRDIQL